MVFLSAVTEVAHLTYVCRRVTPVNRLCNTVNMANPSAVEVSSGRLGQIIQLSVPLVYCGIDIIVHLC